ncbi:hypothetical protein IF1G_04875 [Cordyceps javanica]|uniref:Uncharacterized protein n=1 Tax=Cordyceps javanica TaxID=43265 RepID=A0A545V3K7_9HYPO|nr:hypothetical protein IF1G_04875 [Cordyceps javanica]TQW07592.1 hypothetical protein IF2G_04753 [Cordyceps javanica]
MMVENPCVWEAELRAAKGRGRRYIPRRKDEIVLTYRSHFDPGVSFERIHFAFAVAQAAQAAPHFAVGNFGRSSLGMVGLTARRARSGSPWLTRYYSITAFQTSGCCMRLSGSLTGD